MALEPCTKEHWINLPNYNYSWGDAFDKKQLNGYLCPLINEKYYV